MSQTPFPGEQTIEFTGAQSAILPSVEKPALSNRAASETLPPARRQRAPKLTELQEFRLLCIMYESRDSYGIRNETMKWWTRITERFNEICRLNYRNARDYSENQMRKKWRARQLENSGEESTSEEGSWMQAATRWYEFVIERERFETERKTQTVEAEATKQRTLDQRDNMGKRLTEKSPISRSTTTVSWSPTPSPLDSSCYQDSSPDSFRKSQRRKQGEKDRADEGYFALLETVGAIANSIGVSPQVSRMDLIEERVAKVEKAIGDIAALCRQLIEVKNKVDEQVNKQVDDQADDQVEEQVDEEQWWANAEEEFEVDN